MNSARLPLYQQPIKIPDARNVPLSKSCQMVGGRNANPQNFMADFDTMGVKRHEVSIRKGGKRVQNKVNVRNRDVSPTGGMMKASKRGIAHTRSYSSREMRALAIQVLKSRGDEITPKSIAGILSGRTL